MFTKSFILIILLSLPLTFLSAQPKLNIESGKVIELGSLSHDDGIRKAAITLRNTGNEQLEIFEIRHPANISLSFEKVNIDPGNVANLVIEFDPSNLKGRLTQNITFFTNEFKPGVKDYVRIRANVTQPIMLEHENIAAALMRGKEAETKLKIYNHSANEITIRSVDQPDNILLNISEEQVIPPKSEFTLEVIVFPDEKGNSTYKLKFTTSHKLFNEIEIPVYIRYLK